MNLNVELPPSFVSEIRSWRPAQTQQPDSSSSASDTEDDGGGSASNSAGETAIPEFQTGLEITVNEIDRCQVVNVEADVSADLRLGCILQSFDMFSDDKLTKPIGL